jgi:TonB family protein
VIDRRAIRRRALETLLASSLILSCVTSSSAQDLEALLAKPVSPGSLGLLVPYASDPRVQERWRASVEHPSPAVRATAARLVTVVGVTAALPQLARLVATESDTAVAIEAARGVVLMGAGPVEDLLVAAALRLSEPKLGIALAEARGADVLERLPQLRSLLKQPFLTQFVRAIATSDAAAFDRLAAFALQNSDAQVWLEALTYSHESRIDLRAERLVAALRNQSPEVRAYTWWHLAVLAAGETRVPDGLPDPRQDRLEGISANLAFGLELASRILRGAKTAPAALTPLEDESGPFPTYWRWALATTLYERLHKSERSALRIERSRAALRLNRHKVAESNDYPRLRTVAELPAGYVADVLALSGCVAGDSVRLPGARVRYGRQRRLQGLQWVGETSTPQCDAAARAILAAGLLPAPSSLKPDDLSWIVLPVSTEFLKCLAADHVPARNLPRTIGKDGIVPPQKVRHVNPAYPPIARDSNRQGIVVIESQISPTGCLRQAEVAVGAGTDLDLEAIRAVSGWAFTPTLVGGEPVSVLMTVTVQFSLQ